MPVSQQEQQVAEAEELLGDRLERASPAKGLFWGEHRLEELPPYPLAPDASIVRHLTELRSFCREHIDPVRIDREAEIPDSVVRGLGQLGVLGACLPESCGGLGMSQVNYCRLLETLGGHCASTALFVNAHHSIGPRALVLFGTPEQQQKWLPRLATGEWISAFALTEPEAGSDAANVQTTAIPTAEQRGFVLNGEKRWITNGGIAQVLTVMARTPVEGNGSSKISAFIVTPDMPGFEILEKRMEKCGVRGTATSRLAFRDMFVPREHVLGQLGKGLRVALTVLDFGRTTFGASCTGAAKFCVARAAGHANRRVQFGRALGAFELVKHKLAAMQAGAYAMEACTYQTAALIDAGIEDFMLETAMLKVFATDVLWQIVHDTIQIYGGKAYFTDEPFERLMRDARINLIGEGANDVLRVFSALVGMRDVGLELEAILNAIKMPVGRLGRLANFTQRKIGSWLVPPAIDLSSPELERDGADFAQLVAVFGRHVERALRTYQREIFDRQYQLGRLADAAIELYVSGCVLRRLDATLKSRRAEHPQEKFELASGRYYLHSAARRIRSHLAATTDNIDAETTDLADRLLAHFRV
ncbi:MAG: acyl-CoA dehydrogenase family protein [Pirellulaceae bacterium]